MFTFKNGRLVPTNWSFELASQFSKIEMQGTEVILTPGDSPWWLLGKELHVKPYMKYAVLTLEDGTMVPLSPIIQHDALHDYIIKRQHDGVQTMKTIFDEIVDIAMRFGPLVPQEQDLRWSLLMHGSLDYDEIKDKLFIGHRRRAQWNYVPESTVRTILHPAVVIDDECNEPRGSRMYVNYGVDQCVICVTQHPKFG